MNDVPDNPLPLFCFDVNSQIISSFDINLYLVYRQDLKNTQFLKRAHPSDETIINCKKFVCNEIYCLQLILIVYADSNIIESALSLFSFLVQNADQSITLY